MNIDTKIIKNISANQLQQSVKTSNKMEPSGIYPRNAILKNQPM